LEESGRKAEAAAAWDEAARLLPDSYPVAWHRAEFLESQGRLDEAAAEWRRAIPLGSGAASAHLSLARLLGRRARAGDEKEAWREARRALVANPADAEARLFLAERFAARGKAP
jgi:tetratricopeptide (TPR) repeat protein